MKKLLSIFSICMLLFLTCGCEPASPPEESAPVSLSQKEVTKWDMIIQNNEIKIGVPTLEDTMDNRLIDAFAKEANLTVSKVVLSWDNSLQAAVQNGTVDMLWGQLPATSESSSLFRLSNPYFHSTMLYLSNVEDLVIDQNTEVGVLKHSAGQFMAENYFQSVRIYNTQEELLRSLSQKNIACILFDNALFQNTKKKPENIYVVKEVPYDLVTAFEHNNISVATEAEKIIAKIKADGTASDICLQWYLQDYITK